MIGSGLRLSAEEIEMGLIKPNSSLAQLHIALLKVFTRIYIYSQCLCVLSISSVSPLEKKPWIYV